MINRLVPELVWTPNFRNSCFGLVSGPLEFISCNDQETGFIYMNNDLSEYHQDFYAWSKHNANLLRQGQLSEIDVLNIAEELDDMGISQLRALESRLTVLLAHLLKWPFQPERQTPSWKYTTIEQRKQVKKILTRSPSLKHNLNEILLDAYDSARRYAASETHLELDIFLQTCPYSLEQTLEDDFYPLVR